MSSPVLAVDLGATNLRCALVSDSGVILSRAAQPTPLNDDCAAALVALAQKVRSGTSVERCVVGIPGRIDYRRGAMEYGRNLPESWVESMTERLLSRDIGVPVSVAQDADLAAVGEAYFGAGSSFQDVVYITISTGMGAGVLLGRRLVHGRRSGLEIGLTWTGSAAGDSGLGLPLEDYTSGRAVARSAAERGLPADPVALVELVRAGDPVATGFWARFAAVGALAAVNLAHVFSPEVIVIGGGISQVGDLLLDPIRRAVAAYGPQGFPCTIEVRPSALGDDSGLAGAAAWATAF